MGFSARIGGTSAESLCHLLTDTFNLPFRHYGREGEGETPRRKVLAYRIVPRHISEPFSHIRLQMD